MIGPYELGNGSRGLPVGGQVRIDHNIGGALSIGNHAPQHIIWRDKSACRSQGNLQDITGDTARDWLDAIGRRGGSF